MNSLFKLAKENNRDYVTPEDVGKALNDPQLSVYEVSIQFIQSMAGLNGMNVGVEDPYLCAFLISNKYQEQNDSDSINLLR